MAQNTYFGGENTTLYNKIMNANIPYVIKRVRKEVKNLIRKNMG